MYLIALIFYNSSLSTNQISNLKGNRLLFQENLNTNKIQIQKEQFFTPEKVEYNFSAARNCNDFVDYFNDASNELILKQGGRRKLGEIWRSAGHGFPGDLDKNEVNNNILIYTWKFNP